MGSHEREKSSNSKEAPKEAKEEKAPPIPQEQQPVATTTGAPPDWPGFQAYSPMPPAGYLASSPQPHPYMWGVQQFMPPYGTPPHPYVAMYPYAHPSMPPGSYPFNPYPMPTPNGIAETSVNNPGSAEVDGKNSDGKEKLPIKRSKGSLGSLNMITGRNNEPGKTSGASANGGYSKSGDSASEGNSSEGSDANSQNESPTKSVHRQDSAETSQNGNAAHATQNGGSNASHPMVNTMALAVTGGVSGPTTNLNIGMDYWGAGASSTVPAIHGQVPSAPVAGGIPAARDGAQSQVWLQDERELKRQRRKQSNRESARRSRLRKQAECDELAQRADVLKAENSTLRAEVTRIRSDYDQLLAQNVALKERLGEATAQDDPRSGQNNPHIHIEG